MVLFFIVFFGLVGGAIWRCDEKCSQFLVKKSKIRRISGRLFQTGGDGDAFGGFQGIGEAGGREGGRKTETARRIRTHPIHQSLHTVLPFHHSHILPAGRRAGGGRNLLRVNGQMFCVRCGFSGKNYLIIKKNNF